MSFLNQYDTNERFEIINLHSYNKSVDTVERQAALQNFEDDTVKISAFYNGYVIDNNIPRGLLLDCKVLNSNSSINNFSHCNVYFDDIYLFEKYWKSMPKGSFLLVEGSGYSYDSRDEKKYSLTNAIPYNPYTCEIIEARY